MTVHIAIISFITCIAVRSVDSQMVLISNSLIHIPNTPFLSELCNCMIPYRDFFNCFLIDFNKLKPLASSFCYIYFISQTTSSMLKVVIT